MRTIIGLLAVIIISASMNNIKSETPKPPVAKKIPKADTLHGDVRVDNYYWLRDVDRKNLEIIQYLTDENVYTDAMMKPTEALQETLYNEMISRIKETDQDPPYRQGEYWYYTRTEKGKQYPIYCRKKKTIDAKEEVYFDQNEMSKGYRFFRVSAMEVSPDDEWLAFSVDTNGSENYVLQIMNMDDGDIMRERIDNTESVVWAMDSQTLF
ncbi:MAG: oligopeptidase B, partial [Bacteroidetes bacterium]